MQFIGTVSDFHALRVFSGIFPSALPEEAILSLKTSYYFASHVGVLLEDQRFRTVGHSANAPGVPAFRHLFRVIVENGIERPIRGYTDGLQDMPELIGVPPRAVVERISSGWTPREEFAKTERAYKAIGKLLLRTALFWLTFDNERSLEKAKDALEGEGFSVTRVEFTHIKAIQLKASLSLGDDLVASKDAFLRAERVVNQIAAQYRAGRVDYLVE